MYVYIPRTGTWYGVRPPVDVRAIVSTGRCRIKLACEGALIWQPAISSRYHVLGPLPVGALGICRCVILLRLVFWFRMQNTERTRAANVQRSFPAFQSSWRVLYGGRGVQHLFFLRFLT